MAFMAYNQTQNCHVSWVSLWAIATPKKTTPKSISAQCLRCRLVPGCPLRHRLAPACHNHLEVVFQYTSSSRRVYAAIAGENLVGRSSSESTSSSYSSSSSTSPDRSHSISLSPPVSISPKRSQPKSPENTMTHHSPSPTLSATATHSPSLSTLSSPSPVFGQHVPSSAMSSSPERRECQSPSLSQLSLSPKKNPDGESGPGHVVLEKTDSFSSSKEKNKGGSPRLSNASSIGKLSAFSLSLPEKGMNLHHGLDQSPTISDVSDRYRHSPLSSQPLCRR
ncbi:putative protein TPRXL [Cajanus cajan]|uniref:putative protein TPRXL n=1 Tax=Cajanus cajan TaxID=3821 RepID=UPI00098D7690|nr:putative protein TPRXL [Cajanus cajan]